MLGALKTYLNKVPAWAGVSIATGAVAAAGFTVWQLQITKTPVSSSKTATLIAPVAPTAATSSVPNSPATAVPSINQATTVEKPVPPAATTAAEPIVGPSFDIARVEKNGDTLVAGRAAPDTTVELLDGGKVIGQIKTDSAGQFVLLPQGLAAGSHLLSLQTSDGQQHVIDSQTNITVVIAKAEAPIVAMSTPGEPTKILSDTKPSAPKPVPEVMIRTVEAGEGGALFASGSAMPGQNVQIYLSDMPIAKAITADDGHWSLKVSKGLHAGSYRVRADAIDANGNVVARAEVPFDYPEETVAAKTATVMPPAAQTPSVKIPAVQTPAAQPPDAPAPISKASEPQSEQNKSVAVVAAIVPTGAPNSETTPSTAIVTPAQTPVAPSAHSSADAVVAQLDTAQVSRGDSLWRISRKIYGHGIRYTQIYEANTKQIRDPKLIYPGQILVLPLDPKL